MNFKVAAREHPSSISIGLVATRKSRKSLYASQHQRLRRPESVAFIHQVQLVPKPQRFQ